MLVYQSNDLPRDQTVSFKYKATTVNNLQRSIFVSSPVHLAYVTLPNILAPREGRKYMHELHQVSKWQIQMNSRFCGEDNYGSVFAYTLL